jgi:hypothetical protein
MRMQKLSKIAPGLAVTSLFISLVISAVAASGNYKLAYRMQKGQTLKYMMTTNADQSMEMQGQEMSSTVEGATFIRLQVEEVDKNGNIIFVYALDSLRTHVKSPLMAMDTTFRNPEGLLGKRTRLVVSPNGKKLKSTVVDSVKLSGMLAQFGGRQVTFHLMELPESEVKIGDSWTRNTPDTLQQGGGKIVATPNHIYTVVAEVDTLGYKCLRITYKGTTAIKGEGTNMGMNFFVDGEGPAQGTAYFAPKEGLLVAMLDNTDLEMTIALTGQMSMTIPQSTSTKTTMVLVK